MSVCGSSPSLLLRVGVVFMGALIAAVVGLLACLWGHAYIINKPELIYILHTRVNINS